MKKINVLITTVGGLTSPDILRALKDNNQYQLTLVGVDAFEFAVGKHFVDYFEILPNSADDEKQFVQAIEKLVQKYKIDTVIPCGNEDNLALAKYHNLVSCKIMVGNYDDLLRAYDKGAVYKELADAMPEHAPKYSIVNDYQNFLKAVKNLGYPDKKIVVKPRFGRGGRGVYILGNDFSFDKVFKSKPISEYPFEFFDKILQQQKRFDDLIIMEYLSDKFYSVYSICKNGKNIFSLNHVRDWGNASQTFRGSVFYDAKIEAIASKVIQTFNLSFTNNMELATADDGRIILFDLNPRIGASSGIDKDIGFNFPLEAMNLALGKDITVNKNNFIHPQVFLRFFDQVWE